MDLVSQYPRFRVEYVKGHYVIVCRFGSIAEADGIMTATVDRTAAPGRRLIGLPVVTAAAIDGAQLQVSFRSEDLAQVAKVMQPRIRRRLSPEHRAKLVEAGKPYRKNGSGRSQEPLGCAPAA